MLKIKRPSGSKPGLTWVSRTKLFIIKPAPTSKTNDKAISVAIKAERAGLFPKELPRSPSRSESLGLEREAKSAGASPKTVPVRMETVSYTHLRAHETPE